MGSSLVPMDTYESTYESIAYDHDSLRGDLL